MADWTVITDQMIDPDAPLTSELAYAWRDNPIAIAEGAAGAPRIADAALIPGGATNNGGNFVGNRIANLMARSGAPVGTIIMARYAGALPQVTYGTAISGVALVPASASGGGVPPGISGDWTCLGYASTGGTVEEATTLWCKIG